MSKSDAEIERLIEDFSKSIVIFISPFQCEKNGIDKDDLVQEIRIRIWKIYKSDGHDITHFYSYLKKIVNSVFINEINKRNKEKNLMNIYSTMCPLYNRAEEKEIEQKEELIRILGESLAKIKGPQRQVVQLRLAGLSFEEIARLNKWTYRKTCNLFYRSLGKLKKKIKERRLSYED